LLPLGLQIKPQLYSITLLKKNVTISHTVLWWIRAEEIYDWDNKTVGARVSNRYDDDPLQRKQKYVMEELTHICKSEEEQQHQQSSQRSFVSKKKVLNEDDENQRRRRTSITYVLRSGRSLLTQRRRQDLPVRGRRPLDRMELHSRGPCSRTCRRSTSSSSAFHGPFLTAGCSPPPPRPPRGFILARHRRPPRPCQCPVVVGLSLAPPPRRAQFSPALAAFEWARRLKADATSAHSPDGLGSSGQRFPAWARRPALLPPVGS